MVCGSNTTGTGWLLKYESLLKSRVLELEFGIQ